MQQEKVQNRLSLLKKEFETGQTRLKQLEAEQAFLRETLLRISGAIQVLEELLSEAEPGTRSVDATQPVRDAVPAETVNNHGASAHR